MSETMPPPGGPAPEPPPWDAEAAVNAVKAKAQAMLLRDTEIGLDQRGRITLDRGSTRAFIEFIPREPARQVYVMITCPVAFFVPITPALYQYMAENSDRWYFGHLAFYPYAEDSEHKGQAYINFTHTLLGDFLDPEELSIAVFSCLNTANDLDDEFIKLHGGVVWDQS